MSLSKRLKELNEDDRRFALERIAELNARHTFHQKQIEVKQAIFGENSKTHIFCRKGRKAGGTEILLYPAFLLCGAFRNKLSLLIYPDGPTADKILNSTKRLKQFAPPEWGVEIQWSEKKRIIKFPQTDSQIEILGAHQWETMQGFEFDYCAFDEAADHDPRAIEYCYPNLVSRAHAIWLILGAPPLDRANHYYKIEKEAKAFPLIWSHHKWTLRDNPYITFDIDSAKERAYHRGDGDMWEVQWEANDVIGGSRSVLNNFRPRHLISDHELREYLNDDKTRYFVGTDSGYAKCFANLLCLYHPPTRRLVFTREVVEKRRDHISIGGKDGIWVRIQSKKSEINTLMKRYIHVYDSAALSFASEVRRAIDSTVLLIPSKKQANDEDTYFRFWNYLLSEDRCLVHQSCTNLIEEMENYITDDNNKYPDANNHCLDAGRYLLKYVHKAFKDIDTNPLLEVTSDEVTEEELRNDFFKTEQTPLNSKEQDWPFL